ncbi:MAG: hypothetical protein AAGF77_13805, partial [Bacteroidota bacterium]
TLGIMKKLFYGVLVLAISFASCEKEENNEAVVAVDNNGKMPLEAIASKMNTQLPPAEMEAVYKAYESITYEEFKKYIDVLYTNMLNEGADEAKAALTKELMNRVNDAIYEQYGESYASVRIDLGAEIYGSFVELDKYAQINLAKVAQKASKAPDCTTYPFKADEVIGWTNIPAPFELSYNNLKNFYYWGRFKFEYNPEDCDVVFYSLSYPDDYTVSRLQALTVRAQRVLGWISFTQSGLGENSSLDGVLVYKEWPEAGNNRRTDFGTGAGRVGYVYPDGWFGAFTEKDGNDFADQVKLLLKEDLDNL